MSTTPPPDPEPADEQDTAPEPEAGHDQEAGAAPDESRAQGTSAHDEDADDEGPALEPAQPATFTERHRPVLGVIAVLLSLAVAAFFAVIGPAVEPPPGIRGAVVRWGAPACWFLLAVVFTTWTVRMKPQVTQRLSFVVLGAYLLYMTARFI